MSLNIQNCPRGVRFVVLKVVQTTDWHSRVEVAHSYIGCIELNSFYKAGKLHKCRVFPRPALVSENNYDWKEPSVVEMWAEALNIKELEEYFDD